jgi:hypothetical protein
VHVLPFGICLITQDIPDPPYPRHNARAALPVGTRRELENMSKEETHAKVRLFLLEGGFLSSLFLPEKRGFFDFGRGVRGDEGHTHTKYLTQEKTPKQQNAKPANTLFPQWQLRHASKNAPREPTLWPQPQHATSAKREPILE